METDCTSYWHASLNCAVHIDNQVSLFGDQPGFTHETLCNPELKHSIVLSKANSTNNPMTIQPTETDCRPHVYLSAETNYLRSSLGVTCVQYINVLAVVGFLDRDYLLQNSMYLTSPYCWIGSDPINWSKVAPPPGKKSAQHPISWIHNINPVSMRQNN